MSYPIGKKRYIHSRFWSDTHIDGLDPIEKLLFLYFLTNERVTIAGIYELPLKIMAVETGIEKEMVEKVLKRFQDESKIFYISGWVYVKNFKKYQNLENASISKGIENVERDVPSKIKEIIGVINDSSTSGQPFPTKSKLESKLESKSIATKNVAFSLKEEIKKLEDSPRRDLNIIALYLEQRAPDIQSHEQYQVTIKRHIRAAKQLIPFNNNQILKALKYAQNEYRDIYTIETLIKILTK